MKPSCRRLPIAVVIGRDGDGGGHGGSDFLREGWAAQCADGIVGRVLRHDLRHAQKTLLFDALAGGEQYLLGRERGADLLHDRAQGLRWRDAEQDLCAVDGIHGARGDDECRQGQDEAREIA